MEDTAGKLFIQTRNNKLPNRLPCGTPTFTFCQSENIEGGCNNFFVYKRLCNVHFVHAIWLEIACFGDIWRENKRRERREIWPLGHIGPHCVVDRCDIIISARCWPGLQVSHQPSWYVVVYCEITDGSSDRLSIIIKLADWLPKAPWTHNRLIPATQRQNRLWSDWTMYD